MTKPLRKDDPSAKRKVAVRDSEDREPERFEDLTRRLMQVPKSAVDTARKAGKT